MRRNDFMLAYDGFDPSAEGLREALTSTGNGYLCMRGAAEWEDADDTHYPGTLGRLTRSRHPGQVDRVLLNALAWPRLEQPGSVLGTSVCGRGRAP